MGRSKDVGGTRTPEIPSGLNGRHIPNVRHALPNDRKILFGQASDIPKEVANDWMMHDRLGKFQMISKSLLQVDHTYQRDNVSDNRVLEIASNWWWVAFGSLTVAQRRDGSYWIIDGQHRWLAANKRTDVDKLPCVVFICEEKKNEAEGFSGANTLRGPVSMYHRYRCDLIRENPDAMAVRDMIESFGYTVSRSGNRPKQIACVGAITKAHRKDPTATRRAFGLCVKICDGSPVNNKLFTGLFYLDWHLSRNDRGTIESDAIVERLVKAGQEKILQKINSASAFHGISGAKVFAQGILTLLNHKCRGRRLPDIRLQGACAEVDDE